MTNNNFNEFVNGIRFRNLSPMSKNISINFEIDSLNAMRNARSALDSIDVNSTTIPYDHDRYLKLLTPIFNVPRMSTFAIAAIISRAVQEISREDSFVNVGVWYGFSLLSGMLGSNGQKVVGVDNFSLFGGPREKATKIFEKFKEGNHYLYDMDYREYFSNVHEGRIGFYFYDGDHSYDNQLRGLCIAEPFFSPDCIVMVDDTNWEEPRQATLDFVEQSSNSYEIILDRRTAWNGHPTFWNGIMLLRRTN